MRLNLLLVFVVLIAFTASVKASLCSVKCDAKFYVSNQLKISTPLGFIPGANKFLNWIGLAPGNAKHSECMQKCGDGEYKNDVCENHCDFRFKVGRFAFELAPKIVTTASERLGYGVSDEHYKKCLTDCSNS